MRCDTISLPCATGAYLQTYLRDTDYEYLNFSKRPCILICPGGGYWMVADREAEPVALAFVRKGYQVFVLRYSIRTDKSSPPLGDKPMQEAACAIRYIRQNAAEFGIDPKKISIMGFSAGGHLAGCSGVFWNSSHIPGGADGLGRPDSMLLCYPVISAAKHAHRGSFENLTGMPEQCPQNDAYSLELHVNCQTPPTFIWHTVQDNAVDVENALFMALSLQKNGVMHELHIFSDGLHGAALADGEVGEDLPAKQWFDAACRWLDARGLGPVSAVHM